MGLSSDFNSLLEITYLDMVGLGKGVIVLILINLNCTPCLSKISICAKVRRSRMNFGLGVSGGEFAIFAFF